MADLKACPFCGGQARRSSGGEGDKAYFGTGCAAQRCPAHLFALTHRTPTDADAAWNRRTPIPGHADVIGRLRSLRVLLGIDSPETRGWAPAVRQAARRTIDSAIAALTDA